MKNMTYGNKKFLYGNMGKMGRIVYALGNYDRKGAKF
jgi:hypothetical protein